MRVSKLSLLPLLLVAGCGDEESKSKPTSTGGVGGGASGAATGGTSGATSGGTSSGGTSSGGTSSGGTSSGGTSSAGRGGATGGSSGAGQSGSAGSGNGGTASGGTSGTGGGGVVGTACTEFFAASASLASIQTAINSAAGGDVICVARGATFSGSLRVTNNAPTATARVIVCASNGDTECSASGGANPRFGSMAFDADADGFVFANLDFVCSSGCGGDVGVDLNGTSHIRFEGGVFSGWGQALMCNSFTEQTEPCDDIEIGLRGNLTEITENENGFFGWLSNSFVRINAHDNGDGSVYTHHFYLSTGPQDQPSTNVVFEDGIYGRSSVEGGRSRGTFLNLSGQNRDLVVRNNVFEEPACGTYLVDCSSGGEDPEEFCDGIEVYGNVFEADCPVVLNLQSTQRARIYNNLFLANGQLLVMTDQERPASDGWFYNNTVVCSGNCETALVLDGNDHRAFNNLFHYASGGGAISEGNCAPFGSSGFTNNFLYAPGNSPRLPNCGTGNSTTFGQAPGFVAQNDGDYHITEASPAAGFGTTMNAPQADFDGKTRPNPPSAGAYDVE